MDPTIPSDGDERAQGRRILTGLSTVAILLVIYGSWLPFEFDFGQLSGVSSIMEDLSWPNPRLGDAVTNVVIYVPVALFLSMRLMLSPLPGGLQMLITILLSGITILLSECGQVLIPSRTASVTDMAFNAAGALAGLLLAPPTMRWCLRAVGWLRLAFALQPTRALFVIVAVLVVFAKLAPFDFTIRPSDFERSLAEARWSPFDPPAQPTESLPEELVEMAGSFFGFVLLGILGALAMREAGESSSVSIVATTAKLIFVALGVELAQLLIRSHTCDAADALVYVWGALVGAVLAALVIYRPGEFQARGGNPTLRLLVAAALVVQISLIATYAYPAKGPWVAPSIDSIQWIPFYAQFQKSFAAGAGHIISSFMWYLTLAVIAAAMLPSRSWHYTFVLSSFVTVGLVTLTEAVQAFSLTRYADITEPILALAASLVGTLAFRWARELTRAQPHEPITETL